MLPTDITEATKKTDHMTSQNAMKKRKENRRNINIISHDIITIITQNTTLNIADITNTSESLSLSLSFQVSWTFNLVYL